MLKARGRPPKARARWVAPIRTVIYAAAIILGLTFVSSVGPDVSNGEFAVGGFAVLGAWLLVRVILIVLAVRSKR